MKFFDVDGALYKFMSRFLDMLKLNILWILFSLPIVTCGAATVAAFKVTLRMVDDTEGYVGRQFIQAFKENWKQGIPLGLLAMLGSYVVYLDFEIARVTDGDSAWFFAFGILAIFLLVMGFIYAFPLSARYENTLIGTIKNSVAIASRYFVRTIFLVIILVIEYIVFMFNETMMFFGILIGPACIMLTISGFAMFFFREIEKEPGAVVEKNTEDECCDGEER